MADSQGPSAGETAAADQVLGLSLEELREVGQELQRQTATPMEASRQAMEELLAWQQVRRHHPQVDMTASMHMVKAVQDLGTREKCMLIMTLVHTLEGALFACFGDEPHPQGQAEGSGRK